MIGLVFTNPLPIDVWISIILALTFGSLIILLARWRYNHSKRLRWEVIRDIGIALIVAGVVSGVYEWSTRSVAENRKAVDLFNTINSYNVGEQVWAELKRVVFKAPFLRRNAKIKLSLSRKLTLANGQEVAIPATRGILRMEYVYDLYPLSNESWAIPVQHALDYEMWDKDLGVPRFERVRLTTQNGPFDTRTVEIKGQELDKLVVDGTIRFDFPKIRGIDVPSAGQGKPIQVLTDRIEMVSLPGQYRVVMPVLAAKTESDLHTIEISIDELPTDIEAEVNTFYFGLNFTPDAAKRLWVYDGTMLPGQGFNIQFKRRTSQASVTKTELSISAKTKS